MEVVKTIVYGATFLFVLVIEYLQYMFAIMRERIDFPITSPCIYQKIEKKLKNP